MKKSKARLSKSSKKAISNAGGRYLQRIRHLPGHNLQMEVKKWWRDVKPRIFWQGF